VKLKIDLSKEKEGLNHFFKPYEILAWSVIWDEPEAVGSGKVWEKVNKALGPDKSISRASVIFFLNRQVDLGFLAWYDATGKGGHHRRYYAKVNMAGLVQAIIDRAEELLYQTLGQADAYVKMSREGPGLIYKGGPQ
jgi:hypothetical protein